MVRRPHRTMRGSAQRGLPLCAIACAWILGSGAAVAQPGDGTSAALAPGVPGADPGGAPPDPGAAPAAPGPAAPGPAAPVRDQGPTGASATTEAPAKLRWRGTSFYWIHSVSTQTVGVGQDFQSRNPSYDWAFFAVPRYYLVDDPKWTLVADLELGVARELTNSDSTADQGEFDTLSGTAADAIVNLHYERTLRERDGYKTSLHLILPEILVPTSQASRNNGMYFGAGVGVFPKQAFPLVESGEFMRSLLVRGIARYRYYFRESQVPTNDNLSRVRTDVDGLPVLADQLNGVAFAEHETRFGVDFSLAIHERVKFDLRFEWRPIWKYRIDPTTEICNVATGCVTADGVEDPQRFTVHTLFWPRLTARVMDELSVVGEYSNSTAQLGPDGQRRNMIYSPNARFGLWLVLHLDEVYETATGTRTRAAAGRPRSALARAESVSSSH